MLFDDHSLNSEQSNGSFLSDGLVGIKESVDHCGFVTKSNSDSLSNFLNAQDLNYKMKIPWLRC